MQVLVGELAACVKIVSDLAAVLQVYETPKRGPGFTDRPQPARRFRQQRDAPVNPADAKRSAHKQSPLFQQIDVNVMVTVADEETGAWLPCDANAGVKLFLNCHEPTGDRLHDMLFLLQLFGRRGIGCGCCRRAACLMWEMRGQQCERICQPR